MYCVVLTFLSGSTASSYSLLSTYSNNTSFLAWTGDFSLRIKPVSLMDDGLYQCQVSASDGVPGIRSHAARLTVHVPPDPPVLTPAVLNATAGVPVTLVCESSGGRPAPEVSLMRRRVSVAPCLPCLTCSNDSHFFCLLFFLSLLPSLLHSFPPLVHPYKSLHIQNSPQVLYQQH